MTEEGLTAIRARVTEQPNEYEAIDKRGMPRGKYLLRPMVDYPQSAGQYRSDAMRLLAEVDRLRAENAAMSEART